MRISLSPNGEDFAKQVAQLRRGLGSLAIEEDAAEQATSPRAQQAMSARMALAVFVPFLTALRTELRGRAINPHAIRRAVADLCSNIAVTALQSMIEAPPDVITAEVETLLYMAKETAAQSIAEEEAHEQETVRAKLDVIVGGKPEGATSAIHQGPKP